MKRLIFLFLMTCVINDLLNAQAIDRKKNMEADSMPKKRTEEKDVRDVFRHAFNIKKKDSHVNSKDSNIFLAPLSYPVLEDESDVMQPGKVSFAIFPAIGYSLQTSTTAILAMNLSFLNGDIDSTNLSSINIVPLMSLKFPQYLLNIVSNIWSKNNKYDFLGDWRAYQYPTYTYGLGGHTQLSDAELINYSYIRIYQSALKQISRSKFYGGIGYNLDYHFNIKEMGTGKDFQPYNNGAEKTISSGLSCTFLYDSRKNINNPGSSAYFNLSYRANSTYLGSDQNWQSIYMETKKFIKLSSRSDNVIGFWNLNWFTFGGKPPYFDLPSTGWDSYSNTGRGYIQSRLRGPGMLYLESEYRFRLSRNGLFGGVVFVNGESVSEKDSYNFETILPGTGLGIRLKLNKISGANLAIDYGFGAGGSRGLFFNVSEVF